MDGSADAVRALHWLPPEPARADCPVCPSHHAHDVLALPHPHRADEELRVSRCDACGSVFLADGGQHVSHDEGLADDVFLTWYLECGAGIDAMLQPLVALPLPAGGSLLDVGCGYGFTVWFAQQHLRMRATGLERAPYGRRGAQLLGIDVRPAYVGDPGATDGGPFDVVHASEVVEHVEDPLAFLRALRGACAPDGLLVLTTPNADVVRPGTPDPVVVEALSPGLHRYLLSPGRLQALLTEAGFSEQRLVRNGGHLVVWASARAVPELTWAPLDPALSVAVLEGLRDLPEPALSRGAAYRLLREQVAAGRVEDAARALEDVRALVHRDLGSDPLQEGAAVAHGRTAGPADRAGRWPSFLGPLLHWAGMLTTLTAPSDVGRRVRLLADALAVEQHEVATGPQYAHEAAALAESTRFHLAQACLQGAARELPVLLGTVTDELGLTPGAHAARALDELARLDTAVRIPEPAPPPPPPPPSRWRRVLDRAAP